MLDKDYIPVLKQYTRNSLNYAPILAKKYNISVRMARSIIIHGWRRIIRLMRNGNNEFHIDKFGHIYPRKYQTKLRKLRRKNHEQKETKSSSNSNTITNNNATTSII